MSYRTRLGINVRIKRTNWVYFLAVVLFASFIVEPSYADPSAAARRNTREWIDARRAAGCNAGDQCEAVPDLPNSSQDAPPATPASASNDPEEDESCEAKAKLAMAACNVGGFAGMSPEQGAMMEMMLMQVGQLVSQIQSVGQSQSKQCKNQADLSKLMGLISAAKAAACAAAMSACKNSCENDIEKTEEQLSMLRQSQPPPQEQIAELRKQVGKFKKELNTCQSYNNNMMLSLMQMMQMGQNMLQNKACAEQTSTQATGTPWEFPSPTPGPTPYVFDPSCNNPDVAQSSMKCLCEKEPNNQLCKGWTPPPNTNTNNNGPVGPQTPGRPFDPLSNNKTGGYTPVTGEQAKADSARGADAGGGGGSGGGFGGGGGVGALGQADEAGAGGAGIDKNVITGAGSGSGGGGSGGGGGGYGNGGGAGGGGRNGGGGGFLDKLNLKKFLPNKKDYKNRGLSGMSVPSQDGVTGPMGPSIWEKVNIQYKNQQQKKSFLQDI